MFLLFFFLSVYIRIVNVRLQLLPNRYSSISALECGCPTVCLYLCLVDGQFIFRQIVGLLSCPTSERQICTWQDKVMSFLTNTGIVSLSFGHNARPNGCQLYFTETLMWPNINLVEKWTWCSDYKRPKLQRTALAPLFDFLSGFYLRQSWHKIFKIAFETMGSEK